MSIRQRVHHYLGARQQHPAWRLLVSPRAPLMLGCLTALFETHSKEGSIAEADALQALSQMLLDFANQAEFAVDVDNPQQQAGRELREWIKRGLVIERGHRLYETDALNRAVQFIDSLDNSFMTSTASRLSVVQEQIHQLETGLDSNPANRASELRSRIARLEQELADVEAGKIEVLDEAQAVEAIRDLYMLASGLSADFRRVEDSWRAADQALRHSMIREGVHRGDVVDQLLDGQDALLNTAEGRVFSGFLQQLRQTSELDQMSRRVRTILQHPAAAKALNRNQMNDLRWLRMKLTGESKLVMQARARSEQDVRNFIKSGLAAEHHRVGALLNQVLAEALELDWQQASLRRNEAAFPPLGMALGNVPLAQRLRYKEPGDDADTTPDFSPTETALDQLDDEFWNAFAGLDREKMIADTLATLAQAGRPLSLAELAAQLPMTYDLETLSLWIGMAREAGVPLRDETETLQLTDADGRIWEYRLPLTELDSRQLDGIAWEL